MKSNYPQAVGDNIALTDTTETTILALSTVQNLVIQQIYVSNDSTTDVRIDFRDATAGTVKHSITVSAGQSAGATNMELPQAAVNNNWTAKLSTTPSGGNATVYVKAIADKRV